ncbi:MAG: hypothetical protein J0I01_05630 [Stenotrophomonas nitritireducens]|uniref:Uncharacterized protein n=1 Tax=Stenotrophomonas nitritireducens TaxID=83617 RepID=A0A9D8L185_9GAMM|nr:hypothetical protein [Stenotrophomonas nitritireducens]MBN8791692.1 hypothetical protein [Stenotrophomonas nitritireducens]MBN8795630.1 hypothetical protein [Stenotrophomonas nitritireducens]MBN8799642.1 hypothetical protein [Stenotrophomonas nitritireducens]
MRLVTLIDLGAGSLPAQTPPAARFAPWLVQVYAPPQPPVLSGLTATPVVDGVLLEWAPVPLSGAVYVVGVGGSKDGPFRELAQVDVTRYLYSNAETEAKWFSVTPSVRGVLGVGATVEAAPKVIASDEDLIELQLQIEQERVERFQGDAAEASERARQMAAETGQRVADIEAERAARQAAVASAQTRINEILSDGIITPDEKPALKQALQVLLNELPGIRVEALASGATAELAAYEAALNALVDYLNTLTFPTRWDDPSGNTIII